MLARGHVDLSFRSNFLFQQWRLKMSACQSGLNPQIPCEWCDGESQAPRLSDIRVCLSPCAVHVDLLVLKRPCRGDRNPRLDCVAVFRLGAKARFEGFDLDSFGSNPYLLKAWQ